MAIENQSNHKTMSSTILDHGPNTTHLVDMGVLDYYAQVYGLSIESAATRHLIIPLLYLVRRSLRTSHRRCDIWQLLASETKNSMYLRTPHRRWHSTPTSVKMSTQCIRIKKRVQKRSFDLNPIFW